MNRRIAPCFFGTLVALAMCSWGNLCMAEPVTYFGMDASNLDLTNANLARNNFVATLSDYAEETMEAVAGQEDPLLFDGTPFEATTDFDQVFSFFPLAVSPVNALLDDGPASENGPGFDDWIQFSQPITAFGSYFSQGGDGLANTLTLRLENTNLSTSKDVIVGTLGPSAPFYNIFFFGVIDTDPFDRISMVETLDYDGILLDNAIAGYAAVPEPSTLALLACGTITAVATCAGRRRLRRGR
jgi:hypothetical protein